MVSVRALVFSLYLVACNSHVTNQQQPPDYSKWDCQKVRPTLSLAVGADWNSYLCNAKTKGGNVEDMVCARLLFLFSALFLCVHTALVCFFSLFLSLGY